MKYDIYHDESKQDWYWHCFLFVPKDTKEIVLNEFRKVTKNIKWKIHFCELNRWENSNKINFCKSLLSILVSSLQQLDKWKMEPYYLKTNNKSNFSKEEMRKYWDYWFFQTSPKFKISIFHQLNNHEDMWWIDKLTNIETSFRMWLQWAKHFLFNDENKIIIDWVYLDGFKHYPNDSIFKRDFDIEKIKTKLKSNSRNYVSFTDNFHIIDWKENEDDKIFLDIIDLFVWIVRLKYLSTIDVNLLDDQRLILWEEIKELFNKLDWWRIRMKNSRYNNFWSFSSWKIENNNWVFENINLKIKENENKIHNQKILTLF